jgi:hypothetical protein
LEKVSGHDSWLLGRQLFFASCKEMEGRRRVRTVCARQECAAAAAAAIAPMARSSDRGGELRACERCRVSVALVTSFSLVRMVV